jgi:hypothetical protein
MLGNPFFSARLGTALFDSNEVSGEGQRKTGASTGLRLEARDSWPPAGSELRLVLMSILSDSFNVQDRPLEDCMSFSIRDMPTEELEKCRDVDSIHALDFLRLQYTVPNEILEVIITPQVLDKYDRIFQHLLRTMRLQAVTQRLLRDRVCASANQRVNDKLIIEMHHFISTLADYVHNIAIELIWRKFETVLREAKRHIDGQNYEKTMRAVKGLHHLHALHDRSLNDILSALLLKQKQTATRLILEDIYGVILRFAAERRTALESAGGDERSGTFSGEDTTKRLRDDFHTKVVQFINALSSSSGSEAKHKSRRDRLEELDDAGEDVDLIECLLLRLDMSGYWARLRGHARTTQSQTLPADLL